MSNKGKQKFGARFLSPLATSPSGSSASRGVTPIPSRSPSPVAPSSSAATSTTTAAALGSSPVASSSRVSQSGTRTNKQARVLEAASCFQALLGIVEKALDGVPVPGAKAAIGATGEVLKVARLKVENDEAIKETQRDAQRLLSHIFPSNGVEDPSSIREPSELPGRIDKFKDEIARHLHELDQYQAAQPLPQHSGLTARVKTWLVTGREALSAEAISKALPDVNRKIAASIQEFMLISQINNEETLYSVDQKVTAMQETQKDQTAHIKALALNGIHPDHGLLALLNPIKTASHDSEGAARGCHKGTREAILQQVTDWFRDPDAPSVLWLSGIAGTGKTTIAQSVCEQLEPDLGASFFFSRDFAERRNPSNVLPTIAHQLAYSHPTLRKAVCDMLSKDPNFASKSLQVQAQELLMRVLGSDLTPDFPVILLLFDALDECDKENNREGGNLIPLLLHFLRRYPSRFKVVITSRPETSIRRMLQSENGQTDLFVLHEVDRNMVQADIETYLRYEFTEIAGQQGLEDAWPVDVREGQVKRLAELADRLFIFAATIVKALLSSSLPAAMIKSFLEDIGHSDRSLRAPLDMMYLQIVKRVVSTTANQQESQELAAAFQRIVGTIVTLEQPLTFASLRKLLNVDEGQLQAVIRPLYSVLDVDDNLRRPIQVFHLSFPDFLTDDARCIDPRFHIRRQDIHAMLSVCCLRIMNEQLKQNMCAIEDPRLLNSEVEDLAERRERRTSAELRYACVYWWAHLEQAESATEELTSELEEFISGKLLHWLELLSLIGNLQSALVGLPKAIGWWNRFVLPDDKQSYRASFIRSVSTKYPKVAAWYKNNKRVQETAQSQQSAKVATLLYDAHRVTQAFFRPISESALQVYESVLMFMPCCALLSQLEKLYSSQVRIISERRPQWSQDLRVIHAHRHSVLQVAVSPNGSLLASCSDDKTIRLWDFASGAQLIQIESDSCCLAFSSDGLRLWSLAVETDDLETWDVVSGSRVNTFHVRLDGDESRIIKRSMCPAISPTGSHVAVSLIDAGLYLFAVGGATTRLEEHAEAVSAVAFSFNGSLVVTGSSDGSICVWDLENMHCNAKTHVSKGYAILQVCMTPDSSRVVALARKTDKATQVWVWTIGSTQQPVSVFKTSHYLHPGSLSVNDTTVACPLDESGSLFPYDVTLGRRLSIFKGHTMNVRATTFSPDESYIISGSDDSTIRIWDAQFNTVDSSASEKQSGWVRDMAFSIDGKTLISASGDETICLDMSSGRLLFRTKKAACVVGFSASNKPVGLYWDYEQPTIDVWNAETGKAIATLHGHSRRVYAAAFSSDFALLASSSRDTTVRIWDTASWECTATLVGHTEEVNCVCFSPDKSRLVSSSDDKTVRVWDVATSDALAVLEGHTRRVWLARFSSDGLSIVSEDFDENKREWQAGVNFPPTSPFPFRQPKFDLDDSGWLFITTPSTTRRRLCWLPVERRGIVRSSGLTAALGSLAGIITLLSASSVIY